MNRILTLVGLLVLALSSCRKPEPACTDCGSNVDGGTSSSSRGPSSSSAAVSDAGGVADSGASWSDAGQADACTADTLNDALNCGACGRVCNVLQAFPRCAAGKCEIDSCAVGHQDLDHDASNGCEFECTPTHGGVEVCDGEDNNCDSQVDEDFDLNADPLNCGACGNVCSSANATAACMVVDGVATCVLAPCNSGFADLNHSAQDGCEYACPVWPPTNEVCNAVDDNCDGRINEGNPGDGQPCDSSCPGGVCMGQCSPGTTICSPTGPICMPGQGPTLEVCDNLDNNCDGQVDEGFDLEIDRLHCGTCDTVCNLPNAVPGCAARRCFIITCQSGFADLDGDPTTGCEYTCPVNPPSVETCNGRDDDCNGVVDDAAMIASQKPLAAGCSPRPGTPCAGADFSCQGTWGWRCNFVPGVEVDAEGRLSAVEHRCDQVDGNCNGQVDESFPSLGSACDNGMLGACRDVGRVACSADDAARTTCDFSVLPDPGPGAPMVEACNGVDDDCNGLVDDGVVDDTVQVSWSGPPFWVDRYEASRPDATSSSAGLQETRRCVNAGVLAWTSTTFQEAAAACAATGARLCTAAELRMACEGAAANAYPYGAVYEPLTCNGLDVDAVPGGSNDNALLPTGGRAACTTPEGIHDLSGNAAEWTSTMSGNTGAPQNRPIYVVHGGSYRTPAQGLTCAFTLSRSADNALLPELGFRCCHD